jgi:hypothetical protein
MVPCPMGICSSCTGVHRAMSVYEPPKSWPPGTRYSGKCNMVVFHALFHFLPAKPAQALGTGASVDVMVPSAIVVTADVKWI